MVRCLLHLRKAFLMLLPDSPFVTLGSKKEAAACTEARKQVIPCLKVHAAQQFLSSKAVFFQKSSRLNATHCAKVMNYSLFGVKKKKKKKLKRKCQPKPQNTRTQKNICHSEKKKKKFCFPRTKPKLLLWRSEFFFLCSGLLSREEF